MNDTPEVKGDGDGGGVPVVNPAIISAVATTNSTVLGAAKAEGESIAFQKVSQAAAFAVQDATDYLRNVMAIASTATGVALKLMIETKDPSYSAVIAEAEKAVTSAQENFGAVGASAGTVVSGFPSGS